MEGIYSKEEYQKAYTELLIILKSIAKEDLFKIPRDTIEFYISNSDKNHKFKYNPSLRFEEQNIMRLTIILFANLYIKYWATDERRKEIENQDKKELQEKMVRMQELYNSDNLFKKRTEKICEMPSLPIIKESFWSKIQRKIKKYLN